MCAHLITGYSGRSQCLRRAHTLVRCGSSKFCAALIYQIKASVEQRSHGPAEQASDSESDREDFEKRKRSARANLLACEETSSIRWTCKCIVRRHPGHPHHILPIRPIWCVWLKANGFFVHNLSIERFVFQIGQYFHFYISIVFVYFCGLLSVCSAKIQRLNKPYKAGHRYERYECE